ncbi:MAG: hypothetical protein Q9169_002819 [Polycauliona sp. 2 TL-2023]
MSRRSEEVMKESQSIANQNCSSDHAQFIEAIRSVLLRLSAAAGIDGINWDIRVVDAPERVKLLVLSNDGKVVVDSGLSSILTTEDELAVVLGHAISHEIANHLSEHSAKYDLVRQFGMMQLCFNAAAMFWVPTGHLKLVVTTIILSTLATVMVGVDSVSLMDIWCKEADDITTLMLMEAGYDPKAVRTVSKKLERFSVADTAVCRYDAENNHVSPPH